MSIMSFIFLILAGIIAGLLTYFQYFYKTNPNKVSKYLAILRFIAVFGLLLLLINPTISFKKYEIQKPYLPIVLDNSESIKELNANKIGEEIFDKLKNNNKLNDKFEIIPFTFDEEVNFDDSITFKGKQSKIDEVSKYLKSNYKTSKYPIVLLSDGNQTIGNDYLYSFDVKNPVLPIVLGDTTVVFDLKIGQINANKYAFLKNKFPVEVFVNYSGNKNVNANFTISNGNTTVFNETIDFSRNNSSKIVNAMLPADRIGIQTYKVSISSSENEKNKYNNVKNFALEVVDQRTEIALVSAINHPDLGAVKKALEHNNQRKITTIKPTDTNLNKYNLFILYQPNASFKTVFDYCKNSNSNYLVVTGLHTDFNFLSQNQEDFTFKMSNKSEDYLAKYQDNFNLFAMENLNFESFPPLENPYGTIAANSNVQTLISAKINSVEIDQPLLCFIEKNNKRYAYLFGQNFWKWRVKSFTNEESFEKFDVFTDKIIQFLSTKNNKKRLVVTHENFYNAGDPIEINAQFFNKNFEFDEDAKISASLTNLSIKKTKNYDLSKGDNAYKTNLEELETGKYNVLVKEKNTNTTYSGVFEVIAYNVEKQFTNSNYLKLNQLAQETNGKTYLPNQYESLVDNLLKDSKYIPIQKEVTKNAPLIDWKWLLFLIILALSAEWFIRKYNGML